MDIHGDGNACLLVADGDDCLAVLIAGILLDTEHNCRCHRASGFRLLAGGSGHRNPVTASRYGNIVTDVALHVDGDGATCHIHIEGSLVGLEYGCERLVDGDFYLSPGILVADGDDGIPVLVARILLHPQHDGLSGRTPALLSLSCL